MPQSARNMVMAQGPVDAGRVAVGTVLHFAFAGFLGIAFAVIIAAAAWLRLPAMRTPGGVVGASIIGWAIVYGINRWALLPPTNPMMQFVPQIALFLTHLLFARVVGLVLLGRCAARRSGTRCPPAIATQADGHGDRVPLAATAGRMAALRSFGTVLLPPGTQ